MVEKKIPLANGDVLYVQTDGGDPYGGLPGVLIFVGTCKTNPSNESRMLYEHEWQQHRADVLNFLDAVFTPKPPKGWESVDTSVPEFDADFGK